MSVGMKELLCSKCRKKVSYHIFKRFAKTIIKDIGRKGIGKVLYTIIIAGIITVVLNPSVRLFLLFSDIIWLIIIVMYFNAYNRVFFEKVLLVFGGFVAGYGITKCILGHALRILAGSEIFLAAILFVEMLVALKCCLSKLKDSDNSKENKLYNERKFDMQRIQEFVLKTEILGINAPWGMGKSFLLDELKQSEEIKKTFEIIQVDLLTCDLDAVDLILVEEIEHVFEKYNIYSNSSKSLKKILNSNKWLSVLSDLIWSNDEGLAASFSGYAKELYKLPRKILLIFEDIDRIENKDTIKKIFAISEKLAEKKLHIVYQFDIGELKNKGFTYKYLEKYIPYTVNLTDIDYEKLVTYLWDEKDLNISETPLELEKVCKIPTDLPGLYDISRMWNVNGKFSVPLYNVSIRRVRFFLIELEVIISSNSEFKKAEVADIVAKVMFIKHFFPDYYDEFQLGESPLEQLSFRIEKEIYSIKDVMVHFRKPQAESDDNRKIRIEEIEKFFHIIKNTSALSIILILGYELLAEETGKESEEYVTESYQNLKRKEKNEKIDRVLWNILANGTSDITDLENAINNLFKNVLNKQGKEMEDAWNEYLDDMYYQRLQKNNRTIFRIGVDIYLPLFRAMRIYHTSTDEWIIFLKFYFSHYQKEKNEKYISMSLIDNLNYCKYDNKRVYFEVIRFINRLNVKYNLNDNKSYKNFFENYMSMISTWGYSKKVDYWRVQLEKNVSEAKGYVMKTLDELNKELPGRQSAYTESFIVEEFSEIIKFVEKNRELIQCEKEAPLRDPSSRIIEHGSKWIHQDEVDALIQLKEKYKNGNIKREDFLKAVEEKYKKNKILLPEYDDVIKDV